MSTLNDYYYVAKALPRKARRHPKWHIQKIVTLWHRGPQALCGYRPNGRYMTETMDQAPKGDICPTCNSAQLAELLKETNDEDHEESVLAYSSLLRSVF